MIPKETEAEILRLFHAEKWRVGTIAGQLGVHHTTVQRVLQQAGVEPKTIAPRPSIADPFVPFIVEQLEKYSGLCSSRLWKVGRRETRRGSGESHRAGREGDRAGRPVGGAGPGSDGKGTSAGRVGIHAFR